MSEAYHGPQGWKRISDCGSEQAKLVAGPFRRAKQIGTQRVLGGALLDQSQALAG